MTIREEQTKKELTRRMIDVYSPTWQAIKAWAEEEHTRLIRSLIAKDNEEIRGAIKNLEKLIALPDQVDPPKSTAYQPD